MLSNLAKITNTKCYACGSTGETESNGFIVCTSCGMTKERSYVDQSPTISKDGTLISQTSIGKNLDFIGALGSNIGFSSGLLKGPNGQRLNSKTIFKYQRLIRNHQNRVRIENEATHFRTMLSFNRIFNQLEISKDIKYRSLYLYWHYVNSNEKITNHILLIALCLLQSVRESKEKAPIRFSEIIGLFSKNGHRVTNKNILRLARELNISFSPIKREPEDYIERITSKVINNKNILKRVSKADIKAEQYEMLLIHVSKVFLSKLDRSERGGVQPYPFAVSIVYLADRTIAKSLQRKAILTQKSLSETVNSAEFTIRDHVYRFLGELYKKYENDLIYIANQQIQKIKQY